MAISLAERIITLTAAAKMLPHRVHPSTIWRWYSRGIHGIRLETLVIAGRRFTSREAIERFVHATDAAANRRATPSVQKSGIYKAELDQEVGA